MKTHMIRQTLSRVAATVAAAAALSMPLFAQGAGRGQTPAPVPPPGPGSIEEVAPSGNNYEIAEFRFWAPPDAGPLKAIAVLVPGSNGDGRAAADDSVWQAFAKSQHVALVACHFKDKQHAQNFIEAYVNVSQGSGQALLNAVNTFATRSKHPELATAPFLLWGMSAGGQFNYEFTAWKPERVAAFVVNKGGIYYSALVSPEARAVPGILFIGGKDLESRIWTVSGLFAVNRRGGALWALANEPGAGHIVGQSRDVAITFYEDILPMRLGGPNGALKPIPEKTGYTGDLKTMMFTAIGESKVPTEPNSWLPTERVARAWQTMETSKP
jgi:poly(3-hydroxybutyrate) depolymerase